MRRPMLLLLSVLAGCATSPQRETERERVDDVHAAFTSADATLVDFEFDAKLIAPTSTPTAVRQLLETQLMYLVGQLNGDRSVGRHDRVEIGVTTITALDSGLFEYRYHAKLPVAWGAGAPPASYAVTLPARVEQADQVAFATKYNRSCTAEEGGDVDAGRMFLFFRPRQVGCTLAPEDVVVTTATVHASTENTKEKYPEYHRIWDDGALDVVAVFGREFDDGRQGDGGTGAYAAFVEQATKYIEALQPDGAQRTITTDDAVGRPNVRLVAKLPSTLPSKREVHIDAILIAPHVRDDPSFDPWYNARTPKADLIIYSGHAGLGENVRTLATKGVFEPKKYVMFVMNGCDTFAYLDRTLTDRRFKLNPDDIGGTKYMDSLSNVLGGYFHMGDETSLHMIKALVSATKETPKTYPQIFDGIDSSQVMVVSGEEDNEFVPGMLPADVPPSTGQPTGTGETPPSPPAGTPPSSKSRASGCSAGPNDAGETALAPVLVIAIGVLARRRRRHRAA
jgi:MYXO-CTERM domain-containing protein